MRKTKPIRRYLDGAVLARLLDNGGLTLTRTDHDQYMALANGLILIRNVTDKDLDRMLPANMPPPPPYKFTRLLLLPTKLEYVPVARWFASGYDVARDWTATHRLLNDLPMRELAVVERTDGRVVFFDGAAEYVHPRLHADLFKDVRFYGAQPTFPLVVVADDRVIAYVYPVLVESEE